VNPENKAITDPSDGKTWSVTKFVEEGPGKRKGGQDRPSSNRLGKSSTLDLIMGFDSRARTVEVNEIKGWRREGPKVPLLSNKVAGNIGGMAKAERYSEPDLKTGPFTSSTGKRRIYERDRESNRATREKANRLREMLLKKYDINVPKTKGHQARDGNFRSVGAVLKEAERMAREKLQSPTISEKEKEQLETFLSDVSTLKKDWMY
jgi:hypothetical protein